MIQEAQSHNRIRYRMALYYLNKLRDAEAAYQYGHEHSEYALKLFDQEWPQAQQWQTWATANCINNQDAARLCVEYPLVSKEILLLRQTPQQRIKWLQTGLEAAKFLNDSRSEATHLYLIASAYHDCGEIASAEEYALQAITRTQATYDLLNRGLALRLLGDIYRMIGKFAQARDYYQQSLEIFQMLEDQRQIGRVLVGFGLIAWRTGDWQGAHKLLTEALAIAKTWGHELDICDALLDLSLPTFVLGDTQAAYALLAECTSRCRAINYHRVLASSLNTRGTFESNPANALVHFQEAISICRKTGTNWDLSNYLNNAGFTLSELGQYAEALEYVLEALSLSRAAGKDLAISNSLSTLVEVYLGLGDIKLSCQSLHDALEIAVDIDSPVVKLHILMSAMNLWDRLGKVEQVAEWAGMMLSLPICVSQERDYIHRFCIKIEEKLGLSAFTAALERGEKLDLTSVVQKVLRDLSEV